ncbi:hypothetical protein, partial [Sphingomonas sp. PP-CE-3G-477]|uniref:hypothetical protein n=1 Tax=Sphingomonas sp. PP-CE-3G-477 TaxID=2135660 RepID=UPI001C62897D
MRAKAHVSVQATGKEKGDQSLARPITACGFAIRPFPSPTSLRLVGDGLSCQKDRHLHKTSG